MRGEEFQPGVNIKSNVPQGNVQSFFFEHRIPFSACLEPAPGPALLLLTQALQPRWVVLVRGGSPSISDTK